MKTKLKLLLLSTFVFTLVLACKKKKSKTTLDLLTESEWNYFRMEEYNSSGATLNSFNFNMYWKFDMNGDYQIKNASRSTIIETGTYTLNENSSPNTLRLIPDGRSSVSLEIQEISERHMVWKEDKSPLGYNLHFLKK